MEKNSQKKTKVTKDEDLVAAMSEVAAQKSVPCFRRQ
ncbi:MAG: hypothetical protein QOJ87_2551 [Verrucomicrobiota bacterium]|jgi:hypothetical protein